MNKSGAIEYKMPKAMADAYLKTRNEEEKKMRPADFLVKVVNEQFGLLHNCVQVLIY